MGLLLFLLVMALVVPLSFLPFRVLYAISNGIAWLLRDVVKYRRGVVNTNLKESFPEKSAADIKQIEKQFYTHLADLIVEAVKLMNISKKEVAKRCLYINPEILHRHFERGETVIVAAGHSGNSELATQSMAVEFNQQSISFYRELTNSYFNEFLIKIRTRFGLKLVSERQSRLLLRIAKEPSIVLVPGDQTPSNTRAAYWTNFLHQDTPVLKGLERMAKMLNAPVYFAHMERVERGQYSIRIEELSQNPKEEPENAITEKYITQLEKAIAQQPYNWLWSHRRWKHKRPEGM